MSEDTTIKTDVKQEKDTKVENNVPISRLNEVITERNTLRDQMIAVEKQQEDVKRAKLQEEEKWQELNSELVKELDSYKPYKERWESMDLKLRNEALASLPESKREKFSNLPTESLVDVVEELSSVKSNPKNNVGTVPRKDLNFKNISKEDRRDNWKTILSNFKR